MKFIKFLSQLFILGVIFVLAAVILPNKSDKTSILGQSMEPSLEDKSTVFFKRYSKFKRGDIVIFSLDKNNKVKKKYIKRVVGLPNDVLAFDNFGNLLSINGNNIPYFKISDSNIFENKKLTSKKLKEHFFILYPYLNKIDQVTFSVYLADTSSLDLKDKEFQNYTELVFDYPFLKNHNYKITIPKDYYFVLSDNRHVGEDSRKFGLIHKDNFSGIAFK